MLFSLREVQVNARTLLAKEAGQILRLALRGWGYTLRLTVLLLVMGVPIGVALSAYLMFRNIK